MTRHFNLKILMRRLIWIPIWFLGFTGVYSAGGDEIVDRIVAVVNDDIITYLEVQEEMFPYEEKIKAVGYDPEKEQQMLFKVRNDIVNKLVDQKITDQEIKRNKITVSEEDIDNNIEHVKKGKMWTDEDLRKALEKEGMTIKAYREKLKEQALRSRLVNTAVRSKIVITKEDVAEYYENNIEKYQGELKYHLRNIIMRVKYDADAGGKSAVFQTMEKIRAELDKGVAFDSLSRQYSESASAEDGGDLGVLAYNNFSPQLKEALDGLSIGDSTAVLDTDQGYQIFYIENILRENEISPKDAYREIEENLFKELSEKSFVQWLEQLREASHIKITL